MYKKKGLWLKELNQWGKNSQGMVMKLTYGISPLLCPAGCALAPVLPAAQKFNALLRGILYGN